MARRTQTQNRQGRPYDRGQNPKTKLTDDKTIIVEEISTGITPVQIPGAPTSPASVGTISADSTIEYVSNGYFAWTASFLKTLSWTADPLAQNFGADVWERMALDPQVAKCLRIRKHAVLSNGLKVEAINSEDPKAVEIAEFWERQIKRFDFHAYAYNMLDALLLGYKIAEQIFEIPESGSDKGRLCIKRISVKPRMSCAFVVDVYLNVVGILGMIPGQGAPLIVDGLFGDPENVPNLLPRRKFAILTNRMVDNDPRGTSECRPAYNAWFLKVQQWPSYLKYLVQFASPSMWGTTPENAMPFRTGQKDLNGQDIVVNPTQQMVDTMLAWHNGIASAFPFGSELHISEMKGEGGVFIKAISAFNQEIAYAILGTSRATDEAEHGSKADSETGSDVLELTVDYDRHQFCEHWRRDIAIPLTIENFGEDAVELVPTFSLGQVQRHDLPALLTSVSGAVQSGVFTPEQMPAVDAFMGMTPVRPKDWYETSDQNPKNQPDPEMGKGNMVDKTTSTGPKRGAQVNPGDEGAKV